MMNRLHQHRLLWNRSLQRALLLAVLAVHVLWATAPAALAGSWNPTLLVNTEAIEIIEDVDTAANVALQFGGTIGESLYWERVAQRFRFTDDVHVEGNFTTSGSLVVELASRFKNNLDVTGTVSGAFLRASNFTYSGAVVYSSGSQLSPTAKGLSGHILLAQGTSAPVWKAPTSSLVWYIDGAQIVTGTGGAVITMPYTLVLGTGSVRANVAPTGQALIVDIESNATSIYSTKPQIAAGMKTSAMTGVFSATTLAAGSVLNVQVDQVGSTLAGSGLTIMLTGTRKY